MYLIINFFIIIIKVRKKNLPHYLEDLLRCVQNKITDQLSNSTNLQIMEPQVQANSTPTSQLNVPLNLTLNNILQPFDQQFVNSPNIVSTEDIFDDSILLNCEKI